MRSVTHGCAQRRTLLDLSPAAFRVTSKHPDGEALKATPHLAPRLAPALPAGDFRTEPVEAMSFPDHDADAVLSIAVLHFARNDLQFDAMLRSMWRVLRPGGILFCRLASVIGIEGKIGRASCRER